MSSDSERGLSSLLLRTGSSLLIVILDTEVRPSSLEDAIEHLEAGKTSY